MDIILPPKVNAGLISDFQIQYNNEGSPAHLTDNTVKFIYTRAGDPAQGYPNERIVFVLILDRTNRGLMGQLCVPGIVTTLPIRGKNIQQIVLTAYQEAQKYIAQWTQEILRRNADKLIDLSRIERASKNA